MKRIFSMFLVVALLLGCLVLPAHAAEHPLTATITAPGEVEVVLKITDDLSGVSYAYASFVCENKELDEESFLNCDFYSEYWDEETQEWKTYPKGEMHGYIIVDEYTVPGEYRLEGLEMVDLADNYVVYVDQKQEWMEENPEYKELPASLQNISITIENPNQIDVTAPKMTGITMSATSAKTEDSVEVIVKATDDISGVLAGNAWFMDPDTGDGLSVSFECEYYDYTKDEWVRYPEGELHGTIEIGENRPSGNYELWNLELYDWASNWVLYSRDYEEAYSDREMPLPDYAKNLALKVVNDTVKEDTVAPNMTGLTLSSTTLLPDGSIDFVMTATDDDSGIEYAYIEFYSPEGGIYLSCGLEPTYWDEKQGQYVTWPNNELHGTLRGDRLRYKPSCTIIPEYIRLYDKAGNHHFYGIEGWPEEYDPSVYSKFTEEIRNMKISYKNNGDVDTTPPKVTDLYFLTEGDTEQDPEEGVTRLAGATRYDTAFKAADELKNLLGVNKFEAIVVADGTGFADALAGSYLAAVKNAPILLVRNNKATLNQVKDYIRKNLDFGGTVYLLGGENAVPKAMESDLGGFNVKRLGGATRYDTNLLILKEAGVGDKDILVCTGKGFADSLSASAVGLPILLVKDSLTTAQKELLASTSGTKYVIGGTSAVSAKVENALKAYGTVKRIAGNTRYETSVAVAKEFFDAPSAAVLAYAQNFPDGLCGGALAYAMNAPLILTNSGKEAAAVEFATAKNICNGYVLGGNTLISDKAVQKIFSGKSITMR